MGGDIIDYVNRELVPDHPRLPGIAWLMGLTVSMVKHALLLIGLQTSTNPVDFGHVTAARANGQGEMRPAWIRMIVTCKSLALVA